MPDEHVSQLHPSLRRCLVETTQIATLDQARAALAQQPFSQLLGTRLTIFGFTVDYVRPARGVRLTAEANVIRAGATQAVMHCSVHAVETDGQARLCAVGQGRVSRRAAGD